MFKILFSLRGRLARLDYLKYSIIVNLCYIVVSRLIMFDWFEHFPNYEHLEVYIYNYWIYIFPFLFIYTKFALRFKRLQDFNIHGIFALSINAYPILNEYYWFRDLYSVLDSYFFSYLYFGVAEPLIILEVLIDILVVSIPPSKGDNKYGQSPIKSQEPPEAH